MNRDISIDFSNDDGIVKVSFSILENSDINFGVEEEREIDFDTENFNGVPYTGSYTVRPNFTQQSLETRNKILMENVNITPIEVQRVSNLSGGKTVYIGGEIDA